MEIYFFLSSGHSYKDFPNNMSSDTDEKTDLIVDQVLDRFSGAWKELVRR